MEMLKKIMRETFERLEGNVLNIFVYGQLTIENYVNNTNEEDNGFEEEGRFDTLDLRYYQRKHIHKKYHLSNDEDDNGTYDVREPTTHSNSDTIYSNSVNRRRNRESHTNITDVDRAEYEQISSPCTTITNTTSPISETKDNESIIAGIRNEPNQFEVESPDCSVCFREHGNINNDTTFEEYAVIPNCSHSFCRNCIEEWLKQFSEERWTCPVCRRNILLFIVSSKWLAHHSEEKHSELYFDRNIKLLQRFVMRELSLAWNCVVFHFEVGLQAIRNILNELTLDQELLFHRVELMNY